MLLLIVAIGLIFDFINGFHDTANAIATSVATRVLKPGTAVLMASVLNVVGALTGTTVATTIGRGIVLPTATTQLLVVAALLVAILWDLITWRFGIPSSSSPYATRRQDFLRVEGIHHKHVLTQTATQEFSRTLCGSRCSVPKRNCPISRPSKAESNLSTTNRIRFVHEGLRSRYARCHSRKASGPSKVSGPISATPVLRPSNAR